MTAGTREDGPQEEPTSAAVERRRKRHVNSRWLMMLLVCIGVLWLGFILGARSTAVTQDDLDVGRRQGYDRQQCFADYISLDNETRFEIVGENDRLVDMCPLLQERLRPGDPPPDVGLAPGED